MNGVFRSTDDCLVSRGAQRNCWFQSENGYALSSILFLITILSLVAAAVVAVVFLKRQQVLSEVARVKAEFAAQSGIAMMLTQSGFTNKSYSFDDGSEAQVGAMHWGVFELVWSEGKSGRFQSTRIVLAAYRPPRPFQQALVFANSSHQLVFAGASSITGSVVVGQAGVTTGSVRSVRTPPRVPITGSITKETLPSIPLLRTDQIQAEISICRALLDGTIVAGMRLSLGSTGILQLDTVPDLIESVCIQGNMSVVGSIVRRNRPLRIAVNGRATLCADASLRGLLCLFASQEITVSVGANIEHAILISRTHIGIDSGSTILGQVISPLIRFDRGSVAKYPSAIISFPVDSIGVRQKIQLLNSARVEGLVALAGTSPFSHQDDILEIAPRAVVIGAAYSENRTTLDGTVIGTVFTKDFYFYEAPTQYLGWIKNGVIDRSALPSGFLVPALLAGSNQMDVLDWL